MKEHDMVILIKEIKRYPIGTLGCIVHVSPTGKDFIVEVGEGDTIDANESHLIDQNMDKKTWEAIKKIVEMLKSGELTVDDIRRIALTKETFRNLLNEGNKHVL